MRLCIISPFPPHISGVGQYGWHMTRGLAARGGFESITVLADRSSGSDEAAHLNGPVTVQRVWRRDDPSSAVRLLRAASEAQPDVIWFNAGMTMFGRSRAANFLGLSVPLLMRQAGIPVVTTLHEVFETTRLKQLGLQNGTLTHWGAQFATHMLLRSHVVCVTLRHYAEALRRHYGAQHVQHLPHGTFDGLEDAPRLVPPPSTELLFFTSHAPHRGLPVLVNAFRAVQARYPEATLTIAGGDHPRFPGYLAQVRASVNGLRGLHWLGTQSESELTLLFARARLVVLPYLATTGASSVLHRAAAAGRPVVASDLMDIRLTAEEAGFQVELVPPGDARALAESVMRLLADPARQAAMARHNLEVARSMTLAATCARYEALLKHAAHAW